NLMVLTGDTSTSAGLDRFKKKFPDRYLEVGIAEQNMMGIAAGLSSEGLLLMNSDHYSCARNQRSILSQAGADQFLVIAGEDVAIRKGRMGPADSSPAAQLNESWIDEM
ncbi:MAG: hypothetical protein QF886_10015, partial [Planctomycetota bacterium]|nr:hypothetical protein [Planctomycetota bacterium]